MKLLLLLVLFLVLMNTAFCLDAICREPLRRGYCRDRITRYGYSMRQRRCVRFTYSGCRGNRNRFKTMKECKKKCRY